MTDEATQVRARRRDTGRVIAVAMAVMNVATYGFQMVAARALGPQEYGAFAALMNLLLVVSVMSLAVQATAARRISTEPRDVVADRADHPRGHVQVRAPSSGSSCSRSPRSSTWCCGWRASRAPQWSG